LEGCGIQIHRIRRPPLELVVSDSFVDAKDALAGATFAGHDGRVHVTSHVNFDWQRIILETNLNLSRVVSSLL